MMLASRADIAAPGRSAKDWQVTCLSTFEGMATAIDAAVDAIKERGFSSKDIFATRMTLEEAICNAIKHGHQHDASKVVEVRFRVTPNELLVAVEDEGPGFDPSAIPDPTVTENMERPCGRGLLLIRHYAAWALYNRKGNCVTFCIRKSKPERSRRQ